MSDIRTMGTAIEALREFYTDAEVKKWMSAGHPMLGGATPVDVINRGRVHEVAALIDQLRTGAFV